MRRSFLLVPTLAALALVSGCGQNDEAALYGEVTTTTTINTADAPVPVTTFTSFTTQATNVGGTTTLTPVGDASGSQASAILPDASAPQVTITDTVSSGPINGDVALTSTLGSLRAPRGARAPKADVNYQGTTIDYLTVSTNADVTFTGSPVYKFTMRYNPTGFNFYLANYVNGAWSEDFAGGSEVTVDTSTTPFPTVSFTLPSAAYTFTPGAPLSLAFYALPSSDTVRTGAAATVASPASLTFASPTAAAQTFSVSEAGQTGTYAAVSDSTTVATVSPATSASGTSAVFTVTPVAVGTTAVTVTGPGGETVDVPITVSAATTSSALRR